VNTRALLAVLMTVSAAAALPGPGDTSASGPPSVPVASQPYAARRQPSMVSATSDLDHMLDQLDRDERDTRREFSALSKQADQAQQRILIRGRLYVRMARAGLLPLAGGFDALLDHAARLERLHRALAHDLALTRQIAARRVALDKKLDELQARRIPLELQEKAVAEARIALLSAQDRELAFQRAFSSSADSGAQTAVYGGGFGPAATPASDGGFAAMKGQLPFPVTGRTEIRVAHRSGGDGPGLEMLAPLGTPVHAVFPGQVAFADDYSDYGKTVIIDHGGGYFSVSANLGEISVRVGDSVAGGASIGTVGNTGSGPMLYFEIRKGADTLDPSHWFGI
jgi:murein hydrolase activator